MRAAYAAAAAAALAALWPWSLRARSGNPQWEKLTHRLYAHRGLHDLERGIPENSLSAFKNAIVHGYGAELDVHLLKDGSLAVIHDSDLLRLTGKEGILEDLSAAELGDYRLLGSGEPVPMLKEVLELFDGKELPMIVELKSFRDNSTQLAEKAVQLLDKYDVPYCIESFDPRCLIWLRKNRDEIIRGQLAENSGIVPSGKGAIIDFALHNLAFNFLARPDFIAYRLEDRGNLSFRLCRRLYKARVFYWTIRNQHNLDIALGEKAAAIFEGFIPKG